MAAEELVVQNVDTGLISPDPNQPRKVFDQDGLWELADSIGSEGLLQPITVRSIGNDVAETPYIIIAGERRWQAVRLLDWPTIPAIVRDDLTDAGAVMLQLIENIVRRDLNPIEEAEAYERMLADGSTVQELSKAVGRSGSEISKHVQMLNAREDILDLTAKGHVKPTLCHRISRLSLMGQAKFVKLMNEKGLEFWECMKVCETIYAEENQLDMFPDMPKVSEKQRKAVRSFNEVFDKICKALDQMNRMEQDDPAAFRAALRAEGTAVEQKVFYAGKELHRFGNKIQDLRIDDMVSESDAGRTAPLL